VALFPAQTGVFSLLTAVSNVRLSHCWPGTGNQHISDIAVSVPGRYEPPGPP
jgi:hypothetical protein